MVRYGTSTRNYSLPFLENGLVRSWAIASKLCIEHAVTLGLTALACLAGLAAAFVWLVMPFSPVGKPLEVAATRTSDGAEVSILQVFTGTSEPYEVSLFVRRGVEHKWTRYYLDHEALFWRARLELRNGGSKVVIIRGGHEAGCLDLATGLLNTKHRGVDEPLGILNEDPRTTWPWRETPDRKPDSGNSNMSRAREFPGMRDFAVCVNAGLSDAPKIPGVMSIRETRHGG